MFRPINPNEIALTPPRVSVRRGTTAGGFRSTMAVRETGAPAAVAHSSRGGAHSQQGSGQQRGGGGISLLHAQRLAYWAPCIAQSAHKYGVPVSLVCGIMLQESGGNPKAKSYCGATGLMQLMPATARRMGVTNIWDPAQNIEGGTKYLRYLMDNFHGNPQKVIAGYNAGEGNVQKYGGVPPFAETQHYVPSVMSFAQSVNSILSGGPQAGVIMRQAVRDTMPRHAIANFFPTAATQRPTPTATPQAIAGRLARI